MDSDFRLHLALCLTPGLGAVSFRRLMERFGGAEAVFAAGEAELREIPRLHNATVAAILRGPDFREADRQAEECRRLGLRMLTPRSDGYPVPLLVLEDPPPLLFMQGEWLPRDARALAVVGTRYPTRYGVRVARDLCLGLGEAGWTVVSGLARGIDTAAHEAALAAGGRTVAVLGCGLDWVYPRENAGLARRISAQGCLLSEFPLGARPLTMHFPQRNRIISGLALGTLVVEAGTGSGALITADFALEQGREVFAVPGAVDSPASRGTHHLIQQGAHLVTATADVAGILQGTTQAVPARRFAMAGPVPGPGAGAQDAVAPGAAAPGAGGDEDPADDPVGARRWTSPRAGPAPGPAAPASAAQGAGLDGWLRELLALLGPEPLELDALAEKARESLRDWPFHRILTGLLELEIKGLIRRLPGARYRMV